VFPSRPVLSVEQILAWADAHRARTGRWPTATSGEVPGAAGESWKAVQEALRAGYRGLPGGDSLPGLLGRLRGKPPRQRKAPLSEGQILAWAEAHHRRTGRWPSARAEPVGGAPGETWLGVNLALHKGDRGLPGGDSLARLLDRCRRGE
jgi:hypothetical protein